MKKRVLALVLSTAMVSGILAGCGSSTGESSEPAASTEAAAETEAADTEETAAETEAAEAAEDAEIPSGRVYLLNFKPETNDAWQELAGVYNDLGGNVTVLTAADGQYKTTLQSELAKSEAPTVFNIGSAADAQTYADYIYDLKDSEIYNHMTDKSLAVEYDGKVAGVANCYEAYGLIYNKTILENYCTMDNAVISSVDDIQDLDTLEKVADDINARIDEINEQFGTDLTEAFASAGLDDGSSWRFAGHLANMPLYYEFKDDGCDLTAGEESIKGTYLDNFKNVWDMYVSDSAADPKTLNSGALNAESEFGMGEAVFYQNGDWEFAPLTDEENGYVVTADDLSMMPIYFGVDDENEGLCVGTENYWAVNAKASQEDIDATLEFLNWVITSDEGRDAITNQMGLTAPYDTFTGDYETKNAFAQAANKLMTDGKTSVAWSFNATPNVDDWRADVVSALTAYTAGEGEWDAVKTAFVDGWANQWKIAHEDDAQ